MIFAVGLFITNEVSSNVFASVVTSVVGVRYRTRADLLVLLELEREQHSRY